MFILRAHPNVRDTLHQLRQTDPPKYTKLWNALDRLKTDPRHNSLQTHKWHSATGPSGEQMFVAYAEQHTPSAWRILFYYPKKERPKKGSKKAATDDRVIMVHALLPHPS